METRRFSRALAPFSRMAPGLGFSPPPPSEVPATEATRKL
jgi:hypothetical protein